jgi:uncharacterized protein with NAD-binding domain and iron-sulfur cluster
MLAGARGLVVVSGDAVIENGSRSGGLTRRHFLREVGIAGVAAADALAAPALAGAARSPRRRGRPTVAVLGGGIGGLTAAHELAERGFAVTVYERRAFGGKGRSLAVPRSARGGRRPLPGEHGPHSIYGFYQHIPDTLRRIPFASNPNGVFDNLTALPEIRFARARGDGEFTIWGGDRRPSPTDPQLDFVAKFATHLPPDDLAYFLRRAAVFFSSCDARRFGEFEHISYWDFIGAEHRSDDYQELLGDAFTRGTVAQPLKTASARTIGAFVEALLYSLLGRCGNGPAARVFDRPKNEAWFDPWVAHLRRLGVRLRLGETVTGLDVHRGRIIGARLRGPRGTHTVAADWFVCALPVERARRLLSPAVLRADPGLESMRDLRARWANTIQYFLREPTPITRGVVDHVDSPWALYSISEAQLWPSRDLPRDYGDGQVRDCLSVAISDLDVPGVLYGKPARDLTPRQVARETWVQMQQHLNRPGRERLPDSLMHSWYLDPGLVFSRAAGRFVGNHDQLVSYTVGSWKNRPQAATAIPNLVLAADYVQNSAPFASTEAANEAARHAVNALLERSGSNAAPAHVYPMYRPPEWEPLKRIDEGLYRAGRPNTLDVPGAPASALASLPHPFDVAMRRHR